MITDKGADICGRLFRNCRDSCCQPIRNVAQPNVARA
jgi:hypothetical protein